jgi:hypothetical protein
VKEEIFQAALRGTIFLWPLRMPPRDEQIEIDAGRASGYWRELARPRSSTCTTKPRATGGEYFAGGDWTIKITLEYVVKPDFARAASTGPCHVRSRFSADIGRPHHHHQADFTR